MSASEADLADSNLLSRSQGWSIIYASWLSILSDVVSNNRTFSNVGGTVLEDDGSLTVSTDNLQVQQLIDLGPPPFPLQRNSLHLIHQTSYFF